MQITLQNKDIMVKETKKSGNQEINYDEIISKARAAYSSNEKSLAMQISTGASISRPTRDEEFVCWKNSHWETLTGLRGLPFGKVVQIAGRPDSGKSTHAMAFMKQAQEQGIVVILWDAENKFSAHRFDKYFKGDSTKLFLTTSKLILEGGAQIEKLINATKEVKPDAKILVVWDSVGGTLPKNEGDDSLDDSKQLASASKENGTVLRGLVRLMEKHKNKETNEESIGVLLINQVYANIGSHGDKESGGQKVEYYSSVILQLTRKQDLAQIKAGVKYKTGIVTRARVKKNHLSNLEASVAELDLVITAGGIDLLSNKKTKKKDDDHELELDGDEE